MAKLEVKQVKSIISRPENQKRTIRALGLKKINDINILPDKPEIRGMINTVSHLVEYKEVK